jgi:hypothetical protein
MEDAMEHYTYDKKNGLWYKLEGDYYVPCVTVPEVKLTGIWGERRRHFLKDHQKALYVGMLLDDVLEAHLQEINAHAKQMFDHLVQTMAADENVTEQLKIDDPSEWVGHMNNIHIRAMEIVNAELIYT